jgi:hypothetical protein
VSGRSLEEDSAAFAAEIQTTLGAVLPGSFRITSTRFGGMDRYIVQPESAAVGACAVPVSVGGTHLADLRVSIHVGLDRMGTYLKVLRSDLALYSLFDRAPLVRLDYRADMHTEPVAHWQFHAERGAFSHLLGRANVSRPGRVPRPYDLRDVPGEAALALRELGWTVTLPATATAEKVQSLSKW